MTLSSREIPLAGYLNICDDFERGWIYHGSAWLNAVREGFGCEIFGLITETPTHEVVAITPFMRVKRGPIRFVGSPMRGMYAQFAGPLFRSDANSEMRRQALLSQHYCMNQRGTWYIEWGQRAHANGKDDAHWAVLRELRYQHVGLPTLLIDLGRDINEVWKSFEGRARNMVRKAEKNGVIVRSIAPTEADIVVYYDMLSKTFARQGLRVRHPIQFFLAMRQHLFPAGQMQFLTAEKAGSIVAAAIFLRHDTRMTYLSGTSTEDGARLAANSLIQWMAMKEASQHGVTEYDMGGIGVSAIDRFKTSFGGHMSNHHRWSYKPWFMNVAEPALASMAAKGWLRLHG